MDEEKIKTDILWYYRSTEFKPELPSRSSFRHYRGKNSNGRWIKCRKKIRTVKQLTDWIVENRIIDCYYSTSCWLNPHRISRKNEKNILLDADLVFDIDFDYSKEGLKSALLNAQKLYSLASLEYRPKALSFTGMKGFRAVFDYEYFLPEQINKRVSAIEEERKIYINRLPKEIQFDKGCLVDAYRIIRVLGTAHGKTGLICTKLTEKDLFSPIDEILKKIKSATKTPPELPRNEVKKIKKTPEQIIKQITKPKTFITNQDDKRFVPVLKYHKSQGCFKELKKLNKIYNIGPMWVFADEEYYWCLGIKSLQKRRIGKINAASKSIIKKEFEKYGRSYFQVEPELEFVKYLDFETSALCSKAHFNYLKYKGVAINKFRFNKNENTVLIQCMFKDNSRESKTDNDGERENALSSDNIN